MTNKPVSRTSPVYTRALADEICARLARGQSLRAICRDAHMPGERTVRTWVMQDRDGFAVRYRQITRRKGPETAYSEGLADRICDELMEGKPLQHICSAAGMPSHSTVLRWAQRNHEGFGPVYARCRRLGIDALCEEMMEIANDKRDDWRIDASGQRVFNPVNIARARLGIRLLQDRITRQLPKDGSGIWDMTCEGEVGEDDGGCGE